MKHAREDYNRIQDPAGKIGANEPVFLLRAQDKSAPATLRFWAGENRDAGGDEALSALAELWASNMEQWQRQNGSKVADLDSAQALSGVHDASLDPVEGDLLPPVGSKVLIHLGRQDAWVEHTVAGYYVWGALSHQVREGEKNAHRVFVRVKDAQGYDNARLLSEVRQVAASSQGVEQAAPLGVSQVHPDSALPSRPPVERRRDLADAPLPIDAECALEHAALALDKAGDHEAHAHVTEVLAQHLPKDPA